jgi:hypothetical protein
MQESATQLLHFAFDLPKATVPNRLRQEVIRSCAVAKLLTWFSLLFRRFQVEPLLAVVLDLRDLTIISSACAYAAAGALIAASMN